MSFNLNDNTPIISRDNYEEYLLLYVDEELSVPERKAVESFLLAHPDLQAELDALMSTKLEPEAFSFGNKEALFAPNMSEAGIDEALLLHVDDELSGAEKEAVEKRLRSDEKYSLQHQMLLRTKSDPAEIVPHPAKEELYRHTAHRIGFKHALRIAAAFLLLASLAVVYMQQKDSDAPLANVATPAVVKPEANTDRQMEKNTPTEHLQPLQKVEDADVQLAVAPRTKHVKVLPQAKEQPTKNQTVIAPQKEEVEEQPLLAHNEVRLPSRTEESAQPALAGKKDPANVVTIKPVQPYHTTETAAQPQFASVKESNDNRSGGGLKGFLRKATRMVERRTGINATNDNNELLIGAVAIQL